MTDTSIAASTFSTLFEGIVDNIATVVHGKRDSIEFAVIALLAEGHLLIEDVPGVGKTSLAKALAGSIDCSWKRIQFTPDLLPTDLVGVSVYERSTEQFRFTPGPLFANIVLADEINRASPKTQSALLEAMEERQVSADGVTRALDPPFMVIATQNPVEQEGTYRLPESQLDRFLLRISLGYPGRTAEIAILDRQGSAQALTKLEPVVTVTEVLSMAADRPKRLPGECAQVVHGRHLRGQPPSPGDRIGVVTTGHAAAVGCRARVCGRQGPRLRNPRRCQGGRPRSAGAPSDAARREQRPDHIRGSDPRVACRSAGAGLEVSR